MAKPAQVRAGERGRTATTPTGLGAGGWRDVMTRVAAEAKQDHVSLLSAGVAFYFLIALIPAIAAVVSIYALVADPAKVGEQMASFLDAAPSDVRQLVTDQAQRIVESSSSAIGLSAIVSILLGLWAASAGCQHLIEAINLAYDETDERGFVKRRGLALAMTVGGVVFLTIAMAAIAVVPAVLAATSLGGVADALLSVARWPLLAVVVMVGLAVLYRLAPDRDDARWRWVSPGAVVATLLWLAASVLFSLYVSNFGSYNQTYGSLGAIIIVMLWLLITALSIILGAEVNAEAERQTARDTTVDREQPLGRRSAYAADTIGPSAHEVRGRRGDSDVVLTRGERDDLSPADASSETGRRLGRSVEEHPGQGRPGQERTGANGGWGSVAVSVAGRAVAGLSRRRT